MILAGDIGGTKTILALFELEDGRPRKVREQRFVSEDQTGLRPMLDEFLTGSEREQLERACIAVAGPVCGGRADLTNQPWSVDTERLAREDTRVDGLPPVRLVNDLVATAAGVAALRPHELETLQAGKPVAGCGNRAVVAAGTGLGMAILARRVEDPAAAPAGADDGPDAWLPVASEGGHADFAPRGAQEGALLAHLEQRFERVSWERVVSGPGLENIHEYLRASAPFSEPDEVRRRRERADDVPRFIAETARRQECPVASEALRLFLGAYGGVCGNLALTALATAGLYIGGGIAPQLLDELRSGPFLPAFAAKGRFRELLEKIPVHVILEPETALRGAALLAAR